MLSHLHSALPITVRYARPASGGDRAAVWGLLASNVSIRSFDEIAQQRQRDNYLAMPLGLICLVAGLYLLDRAWRQYEGSTPS